MLLRNATLIYKLVFKLTLFKPKRQLIDEECD